MYPLKLLLISGLLFTTGVSAQDCEAFMPITTGKKVTTTNYNSKDKVESSNTLTVLENTTTEKGIKAKLASVSNDDKGKEIQKAEFEVRCEAGIFYMDIGSMMDPSTMSAYKDMEVKISGTEMNFPAGMQAGLTLPDANMTMEVYSSGIKIMTMQVMITERKVIGQEDITTPAGIIKTWKTTYTSESKMGPVKKSFFYTTWYAPDLGAVRNEYSDKKGKLQGYSQITEIVTP
jgi:hypothetical protein